MWRGARTYSEDSPHWGVPTSTLLPFPSPDTKAEAVTDPSTVRAPGWSPLTLAAVMFSSRSCALRSEFISSSSSACGHGERGCHAGVRRTRGHGIMGTRTPEDTLT
ncbi:hypothetical protein I79_017932 [Cricetulus griseus]|uniref:Uncharacterized protein n=1 Tax=Cricetulus griseus TaxID=10029 RepID=G3I3C8_CRIGR|nr:hypothetical protein I79_017932 [Cricetulus griseus]